MPATAVSRSSSTRPFLLALLGVLVALMLAPGSARSAPIATAWRGVQLHSLWATETDEQLHQDLDSAKQAGANVVRLDIAWATLESNGPGAFTPWYTNKLAAFMAYAHQLGIKVIGILFTTPCWASSAPDPVKQGCQGDWWGRGVGWYPPTNDQDYADFVRFITSTYGSDLAAVEIWNEPDQPQGAYWQSSNPAADYAQLLKAAYPAAKQGDRSVPVLAGSLSGSDVSFLKTLYQDGIQGYYDAIAIHPYSDPRPPAAVPAGTDVRWDFAAGIAAIHALQVDSRDAKPIWVTEFGWNTLDSTPQTEANYITEGYRILAQLPYVNAGVVYELHDDIDGGAQDPGAHYGLLNADYSPKPAYAAFASVMTTPAPPVIMQPAGGSTVRGRHPVASLKATPDSTLTVYIDGVAAGTGTADRTGSATFSLPGAVADGEHSVSATATDPYGNVSRSSSSATFTVAPATPAILNPRSGVPTGRSLAVKLAGDPGDTATVCIDGASCSDVRVDSAGVAVLPARTLSLGRHSVTVRQRDARGAQSALSPTTIWTVIASPAPVASIASKPERLRMRVSALRRPVMHVSCAVSTGAMQRCDVGLYFHEREVGAGNVRYGRSSAHGVVIAVRLNSLGRRLVRAAKSRLLVTVVALVRLPSGRTLTAVRHLRLR